MVEIKNAEIFGLDKIKNIEIENPDNLLKYVVVTYDIKMNLCIQPEFQRYCGNAINGNQFVMQQSRMHSLGKMMKEDFDPFTKYVDEESREHISRLYHAYEVSKMNGSKKEQYEAYMKLIHNLPCGIELWATITSNYLQLKTMVIQRWNHPQKEDWKEFVSFCFSLPEFKELCGFDSPEWDLEKW